VYNHGISGVLKTRLIFLFREWNDKAAGFVSDGGAGGARAVEQVRLVMAELQINYPDSIRQADRASGRIDT
jgi:NAD(P)H-dependent FMN reductase